MSYNSTHTAFFVLGAVLISAFHFNIDLVQLLPLIAPIGAYIALRERSRIKKNAP